MKEAREKAREYREMIAQGVDPIEQKKAARSAIIAQQAKEITFKECAMAYIESHSSMWRSYRTLQNWEGTLRDYVYPLIGSMLVRDVAQAHIIKILEPIWKTKTVTATDLINRLERILDWSAARGYRDDDNPARWRGRLDKILPTLRKVVKVKHHKALSIDDMPQFMSKLTGIHWFNSKCLEFVILTACRSGEARGAVWSEIDLDNAVWTIPAERMKAGHEHQIPLSRQAVELLEGLPRIHNENLVFPSGRYQVALTMSQILEAIEKAGADSTVHGFRSTFRDWAGDRTNYSRDLAEMALAHVVGNQTENAYRRSRALDKRRPMMQDWADYCYSIKPVEKITTDTQSEWMRTNETVQYFSISKSTLQHWWQLKPNFPARLKTGDKMRLHTHSHHDSRQDRGVCYCNAG